MSSDISERESESKSGSQKPTIYHINNKLSSRANARLIGPGPDLGPDLRPCPGGFQRLPFAKGPLDLTEAMLEHYGVSSIRFDGDIKVEARTAALKSFQNGGADVLRWRRAARASTLRGRTASSS